ncbi:MAG: glycosyltransferase family 2 protein [Huintestinicola sp.]|uniref:glycosyltransferase family 2 protein n=1 Tax=Huintestinicola sp. TaxID=2981661 RepID=UPI003F0451B6
MKPKISVVVPCYNCEAFVGRCLESILNQSYTELEIIAVNDGSTDNTGEVIRRYLSDGRVKYIEQPNGGEAAARNTGIEAADGEFIGFVDSDDYIDPQMYSKLYEALCETGSDMAAANYNQVYDDGTVKAAYSTMSGRVFDIREDVLSYWVRVCAAAHPNNYVWSRLYRTDVIGRSGIRFEKYVHSADTLFNFKLLPFIGKCVLVNEGLYNYVQRAGSGIHTVAVKKNIAELYADTFQELADYYNDNHFDRFKCVLPIHAYTRMKNVFFYSRLAGIPDDETISNLAQSWKDRDIFKYFLGEKI